MGLRDCYLKGSDNTPERAAFPVIDAHNHLWGAWDTAEKIIDAADRTGVQCYFDLSANVILKWEKGGYVITPGDIKDFFKKCAGEYPGRFYAFTTATFSIPADRPLFKNGRDFVKQTIETLHEHAALGAKGLKIFKELGLKYRDAAGRLLRIDDELFAPIWDEAGKLGLPVLMHQSDPCGFFEPVTPENEHYESLCKYPSWSFCAPEYPRKKELLKRRDKVLKNHPDTVFLLAHVANYPENLGYVGQLLDDNPNTYIDFSARMDELGRQPYSARKFFIKYQDRIFFGSDMPASPEMYRTYFRFLETYDEWFAPPDYDGTFNRVRWNICGIGLPRAVLKKIYRGNIIKIIPGLKTQQ